LRRDVPGPVGPVSSACELRIQRRQGDGAHGDALVYGALALHRLVAPEALGEHVDGGGSKSYHRGRCQGDADYRTHREAAVAVVVLAGTDQRSSHYGNPHPRAVSKEGTILRISKERRPSKLAAIAVGSCTRGSRAQHRVRAAGTAVQEWWEGGGSAHSI
jgi:hypothetical protein